MLLVLVATNTRKQFMSNSKEKHANVSCQEAEKIENQNRARMGGFRSAAAAKTFGFLVNLTCPNTLKTFFGH